MSIGIWPQKKVKDVMCPSCGSTNVNWDDCRFREFFERDVVTFDSKWYCENCGLVWNASLEFTLSAMLVEDDYGNYVMEQDL